MSIRIVVLLITCFSFLLGCALQNRNVVLDSPTPAGEIEPRNASSSQNTTLAYRPNEKNSSRHQVSIGALLDKGQVDPLFFQVYEKANRPRLLVLVETERETFSTGKNTIRAGDTSNGINETDSTLIYLSNTTIAIQKSRNSKNNTNLSLDEASAKLIDDCMQQKFLLYRVNLVNRSLLYNMNDSSAESLKSFADLLLQVSLSTSDDIKERRRYSYSLLSLEKGLTLASFNSQFEKEKESAFLHNQSTDDTFGRKDENAELIEIGNNIATLVLNDLTRVLE